MKYVRWRQMSYDEQEAAARMWKIKSPTSMMLDGEFIYDHDERARYDRLWMIKEEYDDIPKVKDIDPDDCGCCSCCDCECDASEEEPCDCSNRNDNFECIDCMGNKKGK